ncbi:hypothetical protein ACQKKX_06830 [Neorhizobium sp. NPDC001467]|uniref:hypothetical protein n=1 Tax=Neorhizobium sp. NPDC001467 TaxID=3390595 RepID=UPI003D03EC26
METEALELAKEYRRLGGTRLAKMDDNIIDTRKWDDEPAAAANYWAENIAVLDDRKQAEVVSHLETINS